MVLARNSPNNKILTIINQYIMLMFKLSFFSIYNSPTFICSANILSGRKNQAYRIYLFNLEEIQT
jgi:hypothetical protein